MAYYSTTSKLFLITVLSALFLASNVATARPLLNPSSSTLAARLKLDGADDNDQPSNCWDSLIQLQACSSEIILFFVNGETYLGHGCCEAIRIIAKQCWPNMMDTLGFTAEEGDILEGYCVHETSPPQQDVGLARVSTMRMRTQVP
ncbi:hypothetical protein Patl1_08050 [Pistacia atlantica]|uniref:Uncharacterized protein n=1 Tax=Pistacia atlantica TaxID=434234 RepID=A0ACC1AGU4_9ROSI|nr:hypothetical protein Patl1_08050 [Pistacia atlantica]